MRGARSSSLRAAIDFLERAHSDARAQIELARNRGGSDIEPVRIVWREFLVRSGLDNVGPFGNLDLASLQKYCIGMDEILRRDVLHSHGELLPS